MVFFDFNYVTDPPDDELVNEVTQLNDNWDKLDTRLNQFQQEEDNTISGTIPIGTEALMGNRIPVWTGTEWKFESSIPLGWGAWTDLDLWSPVVERPGYTPKYRVNTVIGKVMLSGGLRADVGAGPWPRTKHQITLNTAGMGIPETYNPVNYCIQQTATGIGTVSGEFASARIYVEPNLSGSPVMISVNYQGDDIGGNFVMLDGVTWWYV